MRIRQALKESLLQSYLTLLAGRWRRTRTSLKGYTILMPVLPEFYPVTELNLRYLFSCDLTHCDELILVSDSSKYHAENLSVVRRYSERIKIRYAVLPRYQRILLELYRTPYVIHGTNLAACIEMARSEYVFLHDMDFFLMDTEYVEKVFAEIKKANLNLISAYTRQYPRGLAPAVYELMIRRDFVTSRYPSLLYGCTRNNEWYSTLEWLFHQSANGAEKLMDLDLGIHFKHLFADFRTFEKGRYDAVEPSYSMFLLYVLCAENRRCTRRIFDDIDDCIRKVAHAPDGVPTELEVKYRRLCGSRPLADDETASLLDALEYLKKWSAESRCPAVTR